MKRIMVVVKCDFTGCERTISAFEDSPATDEVRNWIAVRRGYDEFQFCGPMHAAEALVDMVKADSSSDSQDDESKQE